MPFVNKDCFAFSFLTLMLFIYLFCFIALGKPFSVTLDKSGKNRYPCLLPEGVKYFIIRCY